MNCLKYLRLQSTLVIAISGLLSGCVASYQKYPGQTVIQVNDHVMTAKEFSSLLAHNLKDLDALTVKDPNHLEFMKQKILQDFITRSLTLDYARTHGLIIEEKTLDQEVDQVRSSYPDDLTFRRELALQNQSFSEWRETVRFRLIEKLVFNKINEKAKPPTDDELKLYYEQRKDFFKRKNRIFIQQIVLEDEGRADFIKNELKKKSLEELAKRYSITPEAKSGGVVGWIESGTVEYFDPLFAKPMGQIHGPIKSPFGYHLVRVEKKSNSPFLSFEEVKPLLLRELLAKKEQSNFISWLDSQVRSSKVLKNAELINSMQVSTRSEN
ncbi:MAG: peptidyl-prolyl cis-trans isomerase [Bdellovibrionales bacterium]|nr:peptidyl-prolyl cis-trans isomerase [Bdellovibrionales bacterium]